MTERQYIAFQHPCARAYDTVQAQFCRALIIGGDHWSTILTVNK